MINTKYYKHKFVGLSDEAKSLLDQAYKIRQDIHNPKWSDIYAEWLKETNHKYHVDGEGLKDFRTMAVFYTDKVKTGKDIIKKDTRLSNFDSFKQYERHEMRRRTDIYYDETKRR